jgi:hypothetical protein
MGAVRPLFAPVLVVASLACKPTHGPGDDCQPYSMGRLDLGEWSSQEVTCPCNSRYSGVPDCKVGRSSIHPGCVFVFHNMACSCLPGSKSGSYGVPDIACAY